MLIINGLTVILRKDFRVLLKDFNFVLNKNDKVAIIGEEGNGKSTLLKAIYNSSLIDEYCRYSGSIQKQDLKIGYLEQSLDEKWANFTINEYFLKDNPQSEIDFNKYDDLNKMANILIKLHLDPSIAYSDQLMGTLSGGEKVKLQLAKIIVNDVDILLLDEPTNDLDIETLKWLETFINENLTPIIFISHDETLLANTANVIIHLEQLKRKQEPKYIVEKIPYDDYVEKRISAIKKQEQIARKQEADYQQQMAKFRQIYDKVAYQQDTISRADPHGAALLKKKIKSLKSQEKRYEKEKEDFLEIPDVEEAIFLSFSQEIHIPNDKIVLDLNLEKLNNHDKQLATNIKLNIKGPKHVVIIGNNGVGKTTLLKIIYKQLLIREDLKVGYMPQNYEDSLNLNLTAVEFVRVSSSKDDITIAMTYLGSLKFTVEEMNCKISELSGGQKAKLLILKLILNKCNALILDEPTRNLSPLSNPVIRAILSSYNGSIISVSHDRKYISEVCDIVYELTPQGLIEITDLDKI